MGHFFSALRNRFLPTLTRPGGVGNLESLAVCFHNRESNNDKWILDVSSGKRNGFFVEAGVLDGIKLSSTYVLEKYFGWKGILVEPGPDFLHLRRNRPDSICVNKLISDKRSKETFIHFPAIIGYDCTKQNFLDHTNKIQKAHGNKPVVFDEVEIECVPLADLLLEHHAPEVIDYLTLDIEGAEYRVLKDFPFDRYKFRWVCIEEHHCDELLVSKGYRKVTNKFNREAPWESYFTYDLKD